MEMPKQETHLSLDFSSLLGPIFYCWLAQLLLPLVLVTLVYEKQRRSAVLPFVSPFFALHASFPGCCYWSTRRSADEVPDSRVTLMPWYNHHNNNTALQLMRARDVQGKSCPTKAVLSSFNDVCSA